jgi:hypothetical protein
MVFWTMAARFNVGNRLQSFENNPQQWRSLPGLWNRLQQPATKSASKSAQKAAKHW